MAKRSPKNDPAAQRYEIVPINSIRPHPKNPNKGDLEAIGESVEENGFYGACIVQRSTGHILIGNHRWHDAGKRGETAIPVIFVDVDDRRALKIMMSDNATRQGARTDERLLAEILKDLPDTRGTGYKPAQVDALLKAARPTLDYLDSMRADGDEDGPFDADDEDGGDDEETPRATSDDAPRHALPIVLSNAEKRIWERVKAKVHEKKDKAAFLAMMSRIDVDG